MAAALILFTQAQLEAATSREVVCQCLDDDLDGEADTAALQILQESSAGYVIAGLERIYPALVALVATWQTNLTLVPLRLRDLALDVAVATMAKRHPEYVRRDYVKLYEHVDAQIARVRQTGIDSLGISTPPEVASNQGGSLGGAIVDVAPTQFFTGSGGLGDF